MIMLLGRVPQLKSDFRQVLTSMKRGTELLVYLEQRLFCPFLRSPHLVSAVLTRMARFKSLATHHCFWCIDHAIDDRHGQFGI